MALILHRSFLRQVPWDVCCELCEQSELKWTEVKIYAEHNDSLWWPIRVKKEDSENMDIFLYLSKTLCPAENETHSFANSYFFTAELCLVFQGMGSPAWSASLQLSQPLRDTLLLPVMLMLYVYSWIPQTCQYFVDSLPFFKMLHKFNQCNKKKKFKKIVF